MQDRENYKPPRWGYFGGSVEEGETNLEAVTREAKEELDLQINPKELIYLGEFSDIINNEFDVTRHVYILKKDIKIGSLTVNEGKGAKYFNLDDSEKLMKEYSSKMDVKIVQDTRKFLNIV